MFVAGITLYVLGIVKETGQQPAWGRVLSLVLSRKMPFGLGGEAKAFFFLKIKIQAPRNGGKNTVFHQQLLAAFTHSMDGPILWLCRKQ